MWENNIVDKEVNFLIELLRENHLNEGRLQNCTHLSKKSFFRLEIIIFFILRALFNNSYFWINRTSINRRILESIEDNRSMNTNTNKGKYCRKIKK